jgi:hypothetical protein
MDPNYNPHTRANPTESGDSIIEDYNENQKNGFSIEDATPGLQEDVNPYTRSEAIASLPIPGINS